MTDRLPEAFRTQAKACGELGSPFMQRLMNLLADRLQPDRPVTRKMFNWPGDLGPSGESLPLRVGSALHALALLERCGMQDVFPPHEQDDETLWGAVEWALTDEAAFISTWIDSPPQTNEVRRSAALIAAGQWITERYKLPLVLREIGSSAGLNLHFDRYGLEVGDKVFGNPDSPVVFTPDWTGNPPPAADIEVVDRQGIDLMPIDPRSPVDATRLLSYLWADQNYRMELTRSAITLCDTPVLQGDAVEWLDSLSLTQGAMTMIYSTVAWQYLSGPQQERGRAAIETLGKAATKKAPLAWFRMENDGSGKGAALTLRLWPGDLSLKMGRADFHGRWINWKAPE
ncbi:DUF2332 domain-containing protein [Marivivens aquimaris]|uniref:DUF2332 domain-containing protein n=1 Tax=Marivivens aquimaris TaxID=2774876 RepID=UPI00188305BC|nr:DUF2332 family protein [Marivivens aquimaris]